MSNWMRTLQRLLGREIQSTERESDGNGTSPCLPSLSPEQARALLQQIARTAADDYSCNDCDQLLAQFAEAAAAGAPASELMPEVQKHLSMCHDCHEEFEALLRVLAATET